MYTHLFVLAWPSKRKGRITHRSRVHRVPLLISATLGASVIIEKYSMYSVCEACTLLYQYGLLDDIKLEFEDGK